MTRRDDIDRLARMLDGSRAASAEAAGEERQLASLATLLRDAEPVVPPIRSEFRAELRARVVEAAREQTAEAPLLTRLRDTVQRLKYSAGFAGATGAATVALAGGGVAGAAEFAQPGDLLYGTKLALEDVRLSLTFDDVARGEQALAYAADRLDEAELAVRERDSAAAATALSGATERTSEAQRLILESEDPAALLDLADALIETEGRVEALLPLLDGAAFEEAQSLLDAIDDAQGRLAELLLTPPTPSGTEDPAVPAPTTTTTTPPLPGASAPPTTTPVPLPSDVAPQPPLPSDAAPNLPTDELPDVIPPPPPQLPTDPLPDPVIPDDGVGVEAPEDPVPEAQPAPDQPSLDDVQVDQTPLDETLDEVQDTVDQVEETIGDTVDPGVQESVDQVLDSTPVNPADPAPSVPDDGAASGVDGILGGE